ncbi:MAG: glycosyltransferase family 2 protein [Candidatus Promineifilaceae bacterium]
MAADSRVLVIIPAFNEEQSVGQVLLQLRQAAPTFDRLVVNDGSQDRTGQVVNGLGEKQLRLITNLGYGQALQAGIKYALLCDYEVVVTMDADGQHRPEDAPRLVAALIEAQADVVIGSRFKAGRAAKAPLTREVGQRLFSALSLPLLGRRIYDTTSGFRALRAEACGVAVRGAFMDLHIELLACLGLLGFKIVEVPVVPIDRAHGRSMHSLASVFQYPPKTLLLTTVAAVDALLEKRGAR